MREEHFIILTAPTGRYMVLCNLGHNFFQLNINNFILQQFALKIGKTQENIFTVNNPQMAGNCTEKNK